MIMLENDELRNHLATGVDAKILQYEENAINISDDTIDFPSLLGGTQIISLLIWKGMLIDIIVQLSN